MDLSVNYMGLKLKNPIIVGSSGLTDSFDKLKKFEENGAGAIILKSLFEEQLIADSNSVTDDLSYPESLDYIKNYTQEKSFDDYLNMIEKAKKEIKIPVIASINCYSKGEWTNYAKRIEKAGADGLELNISLLPSDPKRTGNENEKVYFQIIEQVRANTSLPLGIKISHFSAGLANLIQKISWTKIVDNIVLFNRYYSPDIDIDEMKIGSSNVLSTSQDLSTSLRWIAIMSGKIETPLVASTGIHNGEGAIKQFLAGANAVQIVSALYNNGAFHLKEILKDIEVWMKKNKFKSLDDFRGKLSYDKAENPASYERVQFIKYYGGIS